MDKVSKQKIACIIPPYYRLIESKNNRVFPAMHYAAEILYRRGHDVKLINGDYGDETVDYSDRYSMLKNSWLFEYCFENGHPVYDEIIDILVELEPDFIFISAGDSLLPTVETGCAQSCVFLAKQIKKIIGDKPVIIGYGHLLKYASPENLINLDVIVSSEIENYLLPIVEEGLRGCLADDWYQDINSLPLLTDSYLLYPTSPQDWDYVTSSRGCTNQCKFCFQPALRGGNIAVCTAEKLMAEIENRIEKHGTEGFYIADMIFTLGNSEELENKLSYLRRIKEKHPRFAWWAEFHVKNILSPDVVEAIYKSGCIHMKIGVEMGNQAMLDKMNKQITLEEIKHVFGITKKVGIKRTAYVLIGCPGFTDSEYRDMWPFFKELDADNYVVNISVPYIGTALYDEVFPMLHQKGIYKKGEEGFIHTSQVMKEFWGISDSTLDLFFSLQGVKDDARFRVYKRKVVNNDIFLNSKRITYC